MQIQPNDIVFVLNPHSGNAMHPRELTAICEAACDLAGRRAAVAATRSPEDASDVARQAHEAGAAAIFGCGGDGTLSAILQGLPVASPTALGAVPMGTANVWAYETGLPGTPLAAIAAQLAALDGSRGEVMSVDSGRVWSTASDGAVQSQRFMLMASWGLDAAAVEGIDNSQRRRRMKRLLGEPAYFFSAVREAIGRRPWPVSVSLDGAAPREVNAALMTVGNTRMLGTWLEINPRATVVDGELDLLMVEGAPWRALAMAPLARSGWLPMGPGVTNLRFKRLELTPLAEPPPVQVDGDPAPATSYAIDVEPRALRVMCPEPRSPVLGG